MIPMIGSIVLVRHHGYENISDDECPAIVTSVGANIENAGISALVFHPDGRLQRAGVPHESTVAFADRSGMQTWRWPDAVIAMAARVEQVEQALPALNAQIAALQSQLAAVSAKVNSTKLP